MSKWVLPVAAVAALFSGGAYGGTVNFESLPGSTPAAGTSITNEYAASEGMTFSNDTVEGAPYLVQRDGLPKAFSGVYGVNNVAPGVDVGNFMLSTLDGNQFPAPLRIRYSNPVNDAGGQVLDIDRGEGWRVDAFNTAGTVIDTLSLMDTTDGAGDGLATPWLFKHAGADIASVLLSYTGENRVVGAAFDNFTSATNGPTPIPLPLAAWAALPLLGALWMKKGLAK